MEKRYIYLELDCDGVFYRDKEKMIKKERGRWTERQTERQRNTKKLFFVCVREREGQI